MLGYASLLDSGCDMNNSEESISTTADVGDTSIVSDSTKTLSFGISGFIFVFASELPLLFNENETPKEIVAINTAETHKNPNGFLLVFFWYFPFLIIYLP